MLLSIYNICLTNRLYAKCEKDERGLLLSHLNRRLQIQTLEYLEETQINDARAIKVFTLSNDFALPKNYQADPTAKSDEIAAIPKKGRSVVKLDTLKVPRASELVAERLRELIVNGSVPEGENLPSEKELVMQLGVSRATLREALRMLETEGLITTKTGPKGGATVHHPDSTNLTRSLALLLQLERTPFDTILEARRLLEPLCANLAAERITSAELEELGSALQMMKQNLTDTKMYVAAQLRFHLGIFAATHNEVLRLYTTSVGELISAQTARVGLSEAARKTGVKACESILVALENRDGGLAARRVEAHLRAFEAVILK